MFACALFSLSSCDEQKTPAAPIQQLSGVKSFYSIQIKDATWGKNCHGQEVKSTFGLPSALGGMNGVYDVKDNNAKPKLDELCAEKSSCFVAAASEFLGFEPAKNCKKQLSFSYMCFSYDKLHKMVLNEGEAFSIECEGSEKQGGKQ